MSRFSPSELLISLETRLALPHDAAVCIAFSGGLDSTVLLHALARLATGQRGYRLRAAHVDHALHSDSARWREHCEQQARSLQVDLVTARVNVERVDELGLEAAAREARYGAFRQMLRPGEYLLSAHHADDQLETLLLALMRGAGVKGLGAMPAIQPFAAGWLGRPLLDYTRAELETWAAAEGLQWLSDPANDNQALDRNFIRQRVVTSLRERWPAAAHTASRSAEHLQEAGRALEQLAALDAENVAVSECLNVERLRTLDPGRRRNLLRYWLRHRGARAPSTRKLAAIEHDMLAAGADRVPCMGWDGWEIRRHRNLLYCERQLPELPAQQRLEWRVDAPLTLPAGLGRLLLVPSASPTHSNALSAAKLTGALGVRFRVGGESWQPAGDAFHRQLKKMLQAAAILPWWRDRVPLIYAGEQLLAVGDLWIAADFAAREGEEAWAIVWENRPSIFALLPRCV